MTIIGLKNSIKFLVTLTISLLIIGQSSSQDTEKQLEFDDSIFKCLSDMQKSAIGAYFVDNILGNVDATLEVANSTVGGEFPVGSMISLVPTEVMIKHQDGWNEGTGDWEFIELTVSETGSEVVSRGTTEVINQFGGNCFGCHQLARPEWDLICGTDHGCAPLPIDRETIVAIQNDDPRCEMKN